MSTQQQLPITHWTRELREPRLYPISPVLDSKVSNGVVCHSLGSGEANGKISCQAQGPVEKTQGVALKEAQLWEPTETPAYLKVVQAENKS